MATSSRTRCFRQQFTSLRLKGSSAVLRNTSITNCAAIALTSAVCRLTLQITSTGCSTRKNSQGKTI